MIRCLCIGDCGNGNRSESPSAEGVFEKPRGVMHQNDGARKIILSAISKKTRICGDSVIS